eukprot:1153567-Pelagomonas_calceolata.AAC.3
MHETWTGSSVTFAVAQVRLHRAFAVVAGSIDVKKLPVRKPRDLILGRKGKGNIAVPADMGSLAEAKTVPATKAVQAGVV